MTNHAFDRSKTKTKSSDQKRYHIQWLAAFCLLIGLVVVGRLYQLSILKVANDQDLTAYIAEEYDDSTLVNRQRGTIFDRKGHPIALDTTTYTLRAVLRGDYAETIDDPDVTAKILANYLPLSRDEILTYLLNPDAYEVELGAKGRHLSTSVKQAIEEEQLPGIKFVPQHDRQYIEDHYASHLIGYMQSDLETDDATRHGETGIEAAYDELLTGQVLDNNDANDQEAVSGLDLTLTLDSRVTNFLEDQVQTAYDKYKPRTMGAYVVDLDQGDLLASVQRPTFNLNTKEGIEDEWKNLLIEAKYEPGSTVKILTMGIAYDEDVYQPHERFMTGEIQVYDQLVRDYNLEGWGEIPFDEGLARSSNTVMVELAQRIGDQEWIDQLSQFGFGQLPHSLLNGETAGEFDFHDPVTRLMASFGQGFSASPLQLLQAYSAIGNQGQMLKVNYLQKIGQQIVSPEPLGQPISPEAAEHVLELMVDSVYADYGIAQAFQHPTVTIAAKTGTAQIANEDGTGYLTGKNDYFHSVITFFPAEDPQYMVYLFMEQPTDTFGRPGAQLLSDVFVPLVDTILITQ